MKPTRLWAALLIGFALPAMDLQAQATDNDSTGLPGDNFSLEGALELFKNAGSPEAFEKLLNAPDNKVNNLDLNEDGITDYIRVINKKENDVQVFVLQAIVSAAENQDIAVIELEKTGSSDAVIQITGDEDIFGEATIVEPGEEDQAYNALPAGEVAHGPNTVNDYTASPNGIVVNVWGWPCVRYVYAPAYTVWVSPWSWHTRPNWWRPWRPLAWHAYRPYRYRYHAHYAIVNTHRIVYAQRIYRPARVTSVSVRTRNQVAVNNYRVTRTTQRTTVTTRNGRQYQAARRTTTVEGRNGRTVTRTATHVRRKRR